MSYGLKLLVPCSLALYLASACQPDLDSLSAAYSASAGTSGRSSADGGMSSNGGAAPVNPCTNGVKDTNESDADCGGNSKCDRCAANGKCNASSDCEDPLFCALSGTSKRCTEPSCNDDLQNGSETGVDCGGGCTACDVGVKCDDNNDCTGKYCKDGVCADPCTSGVKEPSETDKDCGGECATKCGNGLKCIGEDDCESAVCKNGKCQAPSCSDSIKNQDESFDDCGGVCSALGKPCDDGVHCNGPADCASWICSAAGKCVPDIVVAANAIIDDFEDGDFNLPTSPPLEGRVGQWYTFSDGTGTSNFSIATIERGVSIQGFETKGKDFKTWGSGVGVDMAAAKAPYNASQYAGITFWARAKLPEPVEDGDSLTLTIVFPDVDTSPSGGLCMLPDNCDHHYNKPVQLLEKWQRFTIKFADLVLEPGTKPEPMGFKANALVSIQFRVAPGTPYDVYIDDLAFVK
jgi:hypothetical protein